MYPYKLTFGVFLRVSVCFSVCPLAAAWPLCPGGGSEGGRGDTLMVRACVHEFVCVLLQEESVRSEGGCLTFDL